METDKNLEKRNQILIGVVTVLGLLVIFETGYLLNGREKKQTRTEAPAVRYAHSSLPLAPAYDSAWDPFAEIEQMQQQMNRMFAQSLRNIHSANLGENEGVFSPFFSPDADVQDKGDYYWIQMDIPGLEKDQIKLEVNENALTVSGERKSDQKQEDIRKGIYRVERSYGSFYRQIPLPQDIKPEEVTASYEKGVLTVKIKKETEKQNQNSKNQPILIQ